MFCHPGPCSSRVPSASPSSTHVAAAATATQRCGQWLPRPFAFHANWSNFGDTRQLRLRHCAELSRAKKGNKNQKKKLSIKPQPSRAITFNCHLQTQLRFSRRKCCHSGSKSNGHPLGVWCTAVWRGRLSCQALITIVWHVKLRCDTRQPDMINVKWCDMLLCWRCYFRTFRCIDGSFWLPQCSL